MAHILLSRFISTNILERVDSNVNRRAIGHVNSVFIKNLRHAFGIMTNAVIFNRFITVLHNDSSNSVHFNDSIMTRITLKRIDVRLTGSSLRVGQTVQAGRMAAHNRLFFRRFLRRRARVTKNNRNGSLVVTNSFYRHLVNALVNAVGTCNSTRRT